ncbi:CHAP domain-containing protein [Hyalangium sp.]|uniref:CHAP domain-containing protein n=1 Tax=Hyalangium sp. TaxID=2028555 RepID=UPI002D358082|nr:CHAP domain-containing protein [Hyalangium sp.]HYH94846.1 CHAP domain-containing protein [Hyalangium sp.]
MRNIALLAGMVWMTGCATGSAGAPLGGQVLFDSFRYRPVTPAAMPRAIPEVDEEPQAAIAQAPKREAPAPKAPSRAPRAEPKKRAQPVSRPRVSRDARETVLATARTLVGKGQVRVGSRAYPSDCTGLVEAVYAQAGISLRGTSKPGDNGVTVLYRHALNHGRVYNGGRPVPGDLVFFRDTYDQNRDGRRNDGLTHVGVVDQVDADGTVTVIHRVNRGVVRYRMNLSKPKVAKDPSTGKILNDTLRAPGPGRTFALTGQLFAAYASVLPSSKPVVVARR